MTQEERNQDMWAEIKSRDPDLAKLLTQVGKVFGKPEMVEVNFKDGTKGD